MPGTRSWIADSDATHDRVDAEPVDRERQQLLKGKARTILDLSLERLRYLSDVMPANVTFTGRRR